MGVLALLVLGLSPCPGDRVAGILEGVLGLLVVIGFIGRLGDLVKGLEGWLESELQGKAPFGAVG